MKTEAPASIHPIEQPAPARGHAADQLEDAILWLGHLRSITEAAAMSNCDESQARDSLWSVGRSLENAIEELRRVHERMGEQARRASK